MWEGADLITHISEEGWDDRQLTRTADHEEISLFHKVRRNIFVDSYRHEEGVPEMTDYKQNDAETFILCRSNETYKDDWLK